MKLTKKEAEKMHRERWNDIVNHAPKYKNDQIAKRTDWNDWTDGLHKEGIITDYQVNNWSNPY